MKPRNPTIKYTRTKQGEDKEEYEHKHDSSLRATITVTGMIMMRIGGFIRGSERG